MSLIIREMKIKTTMKCHLKPARMATFNKSTNSTDEDVEKREPSCTVDGNADGAAIVENNMEFLQNFKS